MNRSDLDITSADFAALRSLPRPELAHALRQLPPNALAALFVRLGDERLAELLAELDPSDAAQLISKLSHAQAADVLEQMAPDDAADVVEELKPRDAAAILIEMEAAEAEGLQELLGYPPESAGGLMTPEFVAVAPDLTADEALAALRQLAEEAETIYYIYVTEPETDRLLGVLSLRNLVLQPGTRLVRDLMIRDVVKVRADADRETAARLLDQHHLIALPVVDAEDRLLGIITADDAAEVLLAEAGEDIQRLGGSEPLEEPYFGTTVWQLFRKRIGWLLLLFVAAAYTGTVLQFFESTLTELVALAFFIPLLIGTGGNTGSQTVAILVRAIAVGEVQFHDALRVLQREGAVALLLGLVMGVAAFVRAVTLEQEPVIGLVVGASAFVIVLWAALVAALLPLLLKRLGLDPAVVSTPLITTIVDGTGLFIYFSIARLLLDLP